MYENKTAQSMGLLLWVVWQAHFGIQNRGVQAIKITQWYLYTCTHTYTLHHKTLMPIFKALGLIFSPFFMYWIVSDIFGFTFFFCCCCPYG